VRNTLLRHLGALKSAYTRFAAVSVESRADGSDGGMRVMSLSELVDCFTEAGIMTRRRGRWDFCTVNL
jgi:hypothetical protein